MENNSIEYCETSLNNVIAKIKNRKTLREFLFQMGWYLPDFTSYSHEFVFHWLQNKKQVSLFYFILFVFSY